MVLAIALTLLAQASDERRSITILNPSWQTGEVSMNARLVVSAGVVPAGLLDDVWLELRGQGRDWERRAIPASSQLYLSPQEVLTAVVIQPREIPWLQAGDEFEARLRSRFRDGKTCDSESLVVRVAEAEHREAGLLDRLDAWICHLESLRDGLVEDHRKLSRLEALDRVDLVELEALEVRWTGRLRGILDSGVELLQILDEAVTDQVVDPRGEARYRKIAARLRAFGSDPGPSAALARARLVGRGEALQGAFVAGYRSLGIFQGVLDGVHVWRGTLELRRELRTIFREQKCVNVELDRQRRER